jgi:hypothetical protein
MDGMKRWWRSGRTPWPPELVLESKTKLFPEFRARLMAQERASVAMREQEGSKNNGWSVPVVLVVAATVDDDVIGGYIKPWGEDRKEGSESQLRKLGQGRER